MRCIVVLPTVPPVERAKGMNFDQTKVLEQGAAYMDTVLAEELASVKNVRIVSRGRLTGLVTGVTGGRMGIVREIGRKLDCEGVLLATISRYDQRQGGDLAADAPASAAFELKLVETTTGRVLWAGNFDETQESLLDNLFSFGKAKNRGFKWITVEKLLKQGIVERIAECPYFDKE